MVIKSFTEARVCAENIIVKGEENGKRKQKRTFRTSS